jgi:hypothetical protein
VASATINIGNQLGGSIGTALLNTIFASAITAYLTAHAGPGAVVQGRPSPQLIALAQVHGYSTTFWWTAGIFVGGAVICGALLCSGPLPRPGEAFRPSAATQTANAATEPTTPAAPAPAIEV